MAMPTGCHFVGLFRPRSALQQKRRFPTFGYSSGLVDCSYPSHIFQWQVSGGSLRCVFLPAILLKILFRLIKPYQCVLLVYSFKNFSEIWISYPHFPQQSVAAEILKFQKLLEGKSRPARPFPGCCLLFSRRAFLALIKSYFNNPPFSCTAAQRIGFCIGGQGCQTPLYCQKKEC